MAKQLKQVAAKEQQGFQIKAPSCANCIHFKSDIEEIINRFGGGTYKVESNLRCDIGNFKVGKSNWCQKHFR